MKKLKMRLREALPEVAYRRFAKTTHGLSGLLKLLWCLPTLDISKLAQIACSLNGRFKRQCPICGFDGYFRAFGFPPRWDAECSNCGSLERHRLLYMALETEFPLPVKCNVLHFAPEPAMRAFLKSRASKYVTADLSGIGVDLTLNIEHIALADESFDAVICSHVLEHVDDATALREIHRILSPGGLLYAMTPVVEGWDATYENASVCTPLDRELHFGQSDHVRYFGNDIRARIKKAGFELQEYTAFGEDVVKYGLWRGEKVFYCVKMHGLDNQCRADLSVTEEG